MNPFPPNSMPFAVPVIRFDDGIQALEAQRANIREACDYGKKILDQFFNYQIGEVNPFVEAVYRALTSELDFQIARMQEEVQAPPAINPEMLITAQDAVNEASEALARFEAALSDMPESARTIMELGAVPMFKERLQRAEEQRDCFQAQLEGLKPENEVEPERNAQ